VNTGAKRGFKTTQHIQMMASFNTKTAFKKLDSKNEVKYNIASRITGFEALDHRPEF
jgi:hypothetical protein